MVAKRSNKIFRVQPLAGAAANLADVPHEGMCRGAAANAKKGCEQLAKKTAIINSNINNKSSDRLANYHSLHCGHAFSRHMQDKRMMLGGTKKASEQLRSEAQRIILPPWLGYPSLGCSPAEPDSVSPSKDNVHHKKTKPNASSAKRTSRPRT